MLYASMVSREIHRFHARYLEKGTNTKEENDSAGSNDTEDATTRDTLASIEAGITDRCKKTK